MTPISIHTDYTEELEILREVLQGKSNEEIAEYFNAVENYLNN